MALSSEKCVPCRAGGTPMPPEEAQALARDIPDWTLSANQLDRELHLEDFHEAMAFVNEVAAVANEDDHHPDIFISYNRVHLTLMTHKIGGLSRNDFILAAKIDRLL